MGALREVGEVAWEQLGGQWDGAEGTTSLGGRRGPRGTGWVWLQSGGGGDSHTEFEGLGDLADS